MEKLSKYYWALSGYRTATEGEKLEDDVIEKMITEAFLPGKNYELFLCGALVGKSGTLEEMEDGLDLIISSMEDYTPGDYCIISNHESGKLLFLPIKPEDYDKDFSGNTDKTQE